MKLLLNDAENLGRHLIDFFAPSLVFVKPILLQLRDTLALADNTDKMRSDYILNPINEGDHMSHPTLKMVRSVSLPLRVEFALQFI